MRTITSLFSVVFTLCVACSLYAQEDDYTYKSASQKDRIGIDAGLIFPFGDIGKGLDLSPSWGVNLNFWKFLDNRTIGVVSVGNAWYQLGTEVPTDSGLQDYSAFSMTTVPLMGGIGYVFGDDDLHPFAIIHAGATFVTINLGQNRPSEQINNEAYFTLAGTLGLGYGATDRLTISTSTRYTKMFGEDLQSLQILFGLSYRI